MESNVQIFDYDSKQIRMLTIEGDPWFVAKDVCSYFGDSNYRRSISRIGDDVKGVSQINTPGGSQNMVIINEPGLYELLFSFQPEKARSKDYAPQIESHIEERIKKIKAFKKWVTSEVLPQIRKTGSYSKPKSLEEISLLAITGLTAKIEEQKQALLEAQPKIEFFDVVADSSGERTIMEAAKLLKISKPRSLYETLRLRGVLSNDNIPYQRYILDGFFRVNLTERNGRTYSTTYVTNKGLNWLQKKFAGAK